MATQRRARHRPHPETFFREDTTRMFHIDIRFAEAEARIERLLAEAERGRRDTTPRRPLRHRVGSLIVRLGCTVGGDTLTASARPG